VHGHFFARLAALPVTFALTPPPLPIRAPVAAIAVSDAGAVALADGDVRVMDATGFPVGRLPAADTRTRPSPRRRARAAGGFATAAGVLDDDDFNDPYDADSAIEDPENIIEEDVPRPRRRDRLLAPAAGLSLAAGGASAWVGRGDGLWRLPFAGGAERVALPVAGPVRQVASSADGRVVVAALDGAMLRSDDGGGRFQDIPGAPARAHRLVVTGGGQAYALSGDAVWRLGGSPGGDLVLRGADDITACGDEALALVNGRLVVVRGAPGQRGGADQTDDGVSLPAGPAGPAGAARLACSPDGGVWIAYGIALWISEDRGRSWQARDEIAPTTPIAAVAVNGLAIWVAGGTGLAVLPLRPPSVTSTPLTSSCASALDRASGDGTPHWRWWFAALPRVDLDFAAARSTTRREVRAFVLLSFFLDPHRDARVERQAVAAARAEDQRRAAQRAQQRNAAAEQRLDAIGMEEREAISRLLD